MGNTVERDPKPRRRSVIRLLGILRDYLVDRNKADDEPPEPAKIGTFAEFKRYLRHGDEKGGSSGG